MKHTNTPWKVVVEDFDESVWSASMWPSIVSDTNVVIGVGGFYTENREVDIANANRAVLCVNACSKFSNEELVGVDLCKESIEAGNEITKLINSLKSAANYIDTLGGDSKSYRLLLNELKDVM